MLPARLTALCIALTLAANPALAQTASKPPPPAKPSDVCLSNACTEAQPSLTPPPAPAGGRVDYIGAGPIPAGQAFARYFDGNSPVAPRGRVTDVRLIEGMAAEFILQGEDGKTYRVMGGRHETLTPAQRAAIDGMIGKTIDVRGYLAHDKSCEGGCVMNGRDLKFTDGTPVIPTP